MIRVQLYPNMFILQNCMVLLCVQQNLYIIGMGEEGPSLKVRCLLPIQSNTNLAL